MKALQAVSVALLAALVVIGSGCGKQATVYNSPQAVAQALGECLQRADWQGAAKLFAIEKQCAEQATDWNTYAPQQRREIVQKMLQAKASELKELGLPQDAYSVSGQRSAQGGTYVQLKGQRALLLLFVVNTDKGYKIYSLTRQ